MLAVTVSLCGPTVYANMLTNMLIDQQLTFGQYSTNTDYSDLQEEDVLFHSKVQK